MLHTNGHGSEMMIREMCMTDMIEFLATKLLGHNGGIYRLDIFWGMSIGCTQFFGYNRRRIRGNKAYGQARKLCRSYTQ